jgi:hypothetical protein
VVGEDETSQLIVLGIGESIAHIDVPDCKSLSESELVTTIDLIDKIVAMTEPIDVLSATEKSGNEYGEETFIDFCVNIIDNYNSFDVINHYVDIMADNLIKEYNQLINRSEVAYTPLRDRSERDSIDDGDGENINKHERDIDDSYLRKKFVKIYNVIKVYNVVTPMRPAKVYKTPFLIGLNSVWAIEIDGTEVRRRSCSKTRSSHRYEKGVT